MKRFSFFEAEATNLRPPRNSSCSKELGKISKGHILRKKKSHGNYGEKYYSCSYFICVFHEILYFSRLWIKVIPQGHLIKKFMLGLQISMITHRSLIGKSTKSVLMKVCQSTLPFSGKKKFSKKSVAFCSFFSE